MFGELPTDERDKPIRLAVPTRPLNQVEHALMCQMQEEIVCKCDCPVPFIEDGKIANETDYVRAFGRSLSLDEALTIAGLIAEPSIEKYRKQICAARDLGSDGTLADYLLACELLEIEPLVTRIT